MTAWAKSAGKDAPAEATTMRQPTRTAQKRDQIGGRRLRDRIPMSTRSPPRSQKEIGRLQREPGGRLSMSASHARPLQRSPSVNPRSAPNEMSSSVGPFGSGRTANASRSINRSLNKRLMARAPHPPDRRHVSAVGGFGLAMACFTQDLGVRAAADLYLRLAAPPFRLRGVRARSPRCLRVPPIARQDRSRAWARFDAEIQVHGRLGDLRNGKAPRCPSSAH